MSGGAATTPPPHLKDPHPAMDFFLCVLVLVIFLEHIFASAVFSPVFTALLLATPPAFVGTFHTFRKAPETKKKQGGLRRAEPSGRLVFVTSQGAVLKKHFFYFFLWGGGSQNVGPFGCEAVGRQ